MRHNTYKTDLFNAFTQRSVVTDNSATTPNFGAVFDITDNLSLFGSLAYGYTPTSIVDRLGEKLPDVETRNAEAGVKLDLFNDRVLINASYFEIRESNRLLPDPVNPRFQIAGPGQQGKGFDFNLSGEPLRGWTVQGSFTRTDYEFLTPSPQGNIVQAAPRDQYSVYSSYRQYIADETSVGLGVGAFGRSQSAVTRTGSFYLPSAFQVDLNTFLKWRSLDVNLGVRNVFDRRNFNVSNAPTYLPISEPRTWRLTIGYRFR